MSDYEDLGSDSDGKVHTAAKIAANRGKPWSRHECFRVEKNLQTFGSVDVISKMMICFTLPDVTGR